LLATYDALLSLATSKAQQQTYLGALCLAQREKYRVASEGILFVVKSRRLVKLTQSLVFAYS
jgi:hypothetical protein